MPEMKKDFLLERIDKAGKNLVPGDDAHIEWMMVQWQI
jgi:hypothetical protein